MLGPIYGGISAYMYVLYTNYVYIYLYSGTCLKQSHIGQVWLALLGRWVQYRWPP